MASRTYRTGTAVYVCRGRMDHGTEFCSQEPIRRELTEPPVLDFFEQIHLDVEATRREFEAAVEAQVADARTAREQAERALHEAAEAVERVRRDYTRGALPAEDWRDLQPGLQSEHEAAVVERLRAREREITDTAPLEDAEEATLRWLAELREVIAGRVRDAESVEAQRAALMRAFERHVSRCRGTSCGLDSSP